MRIPDEGIEMLAKRPLFAGLSRKELESVAALGVTLEFTAGQELTREGAVGLEAFLIVEGEAKVTVGGGVDVGTLGPGDLFGEISLLDGGRRGATVVATTDMVVTVFERREFIRLVETSPSIAVRVMEAMGARLRFVEAELARRGGDSS